MCGVVLECGCEYYGSSVDAAGGRGIVEKNSVVGDGCPACNIDGICRTDLQYSVFIISGRSACEF